VPPRSTQSGKRSPHRMPVESGIIVPVPDAERIVGHLRSRHDPQASRGVPAHITVLYPFMHPSRVADVRQALQEIFGSAARFEFLLTEVRRFPETAYLHPDPPEPFVRLTESLVSRWPECPPYSGAFSDVVPHLTVADRVTTAVFDEVERAVAPALPIRCVATEAWLMCCDRSGVWSRREMFSFAS
jgi:2'-5' RNA ligase